MGFFKKEKNDLELHIVCNRGMIRDETRLVELFTAYCEKFHYDNQAYKDNLAIELMIEALHNRFARIARIENLKMNLANNEKKWVGMADICSYDDFLYIQSSKDPMTYKLNQGHTVYLEGYVYEIYHHVIGDLKMPSLIYFYLAPFPCKTEEECKDLLFYMDPTRIYVQIPSSLYKKIGIGDYVCITGKIIKLTSKTEEFVCLDLINIRIPEKEIVEDVKPEEEIDWDKFLSELKKDSNETENETE